MYVGLYRDSVCSIRLALASVRKPDASAVPLATDSGTSLVMALRRRIDDGGRFRRRWSAVAASSAGSLEMCAVVLGL